MSTTNSLQYLLGLLTTSFLALSGCPADDDDATDDDAADDDTADDDTADDDTGDDDTADDDTAGDDDSGDDDTGPPADWVPITGGLFDMGSTTGDADEQPVHSVKVPSFEMWRTEVTVAQYDECMDASACSEPSAGESCNWSDPGYEDHPVNCINWQQAVDFCAWVGGRLPSEAEWEYAARSGGQDITYPWGDEEATCDHAVMNDATHDDGCDTGRTWAVCGKSPDGDTDQGLCDMAGNVWEWVQDWYHGCYDCAQCPNVYDCDGATQAPDDGSAWEVPSGSNRIKRGGGFASQASDLRVASRADIGLGTGYYYTGVRCVR